jgi:hypothetical protein
VLLTARAYCRIYLNSILYHSSNNPRIRNCRRRSAINVSSCNYIFSATVYAADVDTTTSIQLEHLVGVPNVEAVVMIQKDFN